MARKRSLVLREKLWINNRLIIKTSTKNGGERTTLTLEDVSFDLGDYALFRINGEEEPFVFEKGDIHPIESLGCTIKISHVYVCGSRRDGDQSFIAVEVYGPSKLQCLVDRNYPRRH